MKVNVLYVYLLAIAITLISITIFSPAWVSDDNEFLKGFVNHEYLNVLGVIFAISLASLSQAHLSLNRIEEDRQKEYFNETRREINKAAFLLIGLFALAFVIVVGKPLACTTQTDAAIANSLAIFILTMYVLVLLDITMAMFDLKPDILDDKSSEGDQDRQA